MKYQADFGAAGMAKRTSPRTYTHAVAAIRKDTESIVEITWAGRPDLAENKRRSLERQYTEKGIYVVVAEAQVVR